MNIFEIYFAFFLRVAYKEFKSRSAQDNLSYNITTGQPSTSHLSARTNKAGRPFSAAS